MIEITPKSIKEYIDGTRHMSYLETVDIAQHLSFHFDGFEDNRINNDILNNNFTGQMTSHFFKGHHSGLLNIHNNENPYFTILIDERRPKEGDDIKDYRRKIYKSLTKRPCNKVVNELKKIPRSKDWKVDYSQSETDSKIQDDEQLNIYTEKKYPFFKSVTSWLRIFGFRKILIDPNALIVTIPLEFKIPDNEFFKPYSFFIPSEDVWEYVENEIAIFKSNQTSIFLDKDGKERRDFIIYAINKKEIWQITRKDEEGNFSAEVVLTHDFDFLPAFRGGGNIKHTVDNTSVFTSFVDAMLPDLDTAAREISDIDAEVVQHVHSTMWHFEGQTCKTCNGTGKVLRKEGGEVIACTAENCENGRLRNNSYENIVIKAPKLDEQGVPTPPAGFITKDIEMVRVMQERIKDHTENALSAINMAFLGQTPLNESGASKIVDRDDANNFVFDIGYHLVENVMDRIYFTINEFRNAKRVPDFNTRQKLLPNIAIPKRFDFVNDRFIAEQLKQALESNFDNTITDKLQLDFAVANFPNDPRVHKMLKTTLQHNPFSDKSTEAILSISATGDVPDEDIILSLYIQDFVIASMAKDPDFLDKDYEEQHKILTALAKSKVTEPASKKLDVDPEEGSTDD